MSEFLDRPGTGAQQFGNAQLGSDVDGPIVEELDRRVFGAKPGDADGRATAEGIERPRSIGSERERLPRVRAQIPIC